MTAGKKRRPSVALAQRKPTVCVGKGGASEELLKEISGRLKSERTVKVRILRSALANDEVKQVAHTIAERTGSSLVEVRGHTFILHKQSELRELPT